MTLRPDGPRVASTAFASFRRHGEDRRRSSTPAGFGRRRYWLNMLTTGVAITGLRNRLLISGFLVSTSTLSPAPPGSQAPRRRKIGRPDLVSRQRADDDGHSGSPTSPCLEDSGHRVISVGFTRGISRDCPPDGRPGSCAITDEVTPRISGRRWRPRSFERGRTLPTACSRATPSWRIWLGRRSWSPWLSASSTRTPWSGSLTQLIPDRG